MADKRQVCGTVPITYPSDCTYICICTPSGGCHWSVTCGDWTTGGKGLTAEPPRQASVTIDGKLDVAARILEKTWKRRLIVPAKLRRGKIRTRTFKGTPEEIAQALGLQLASGRGTRKR
jgi:hypothetical protein